jgi:hypothetical protein
MICLTCQKPLNSDELYHAREHAEQYCENCIRPELDRREILVMLRDANLAVYQNRLDDAREIMATMHLVAGWGEPIDWTTREGVARANVGEL